MRVVVIDYGLCNLLSVYNALKFIGVDSMVSHNSHDLERADAVILPGVGAFEDGMKGLREKGFIKPIHDYVMTGRPLMTSALERQCKWPSTCPPSPGPTTAVSPTPILRR